MALRSLVPREYWPTSPRHGNEGAKILRMQNMILRGSDAEPYAEVYAGSLNLNEDIPASVITGTVACTINNLEVVGTGTLFTTELHLGQRLEVYGGAPAITIPLVVDEITDNTHFKVCRAPYASTTGASCVRLPRLFEMNKRRGSLIWGNAIEFDLGTILAVGDGELRRNGSVLPGTSLSFVGVPRIPKIAVFNSGAGTYSVYTLGMTTPASLTAAAIAGTGKNMEAGEYSARVVPARLATNGYNNPSVKAQVTLTAGQAIRLTFPAANTANGQDAWMIFVDKFTEEGGINGPWYRYEPGGIIFVRVGSGGGEIPAAGGTYDVEYNDAELGDTLLTFNNVPPPHAEFLGVLAGIPLWLSCQGPGATSPGPFVAAAKNRNIEAVPPVFYSAPSPPDTIIGFAMAQERLYLLCVNTLQIVIPTGATDPRLPPVVIRPHWRTGFKAPDSLIFVDGYLMGMTGHGLVRSLAEGDESREEFRFALAVEEILRTINPGHCLLALDPKNNAVCLFISGYDRNASGYWTTRVLMYGLREDRWIGDILLTSTTGDMIVSGVATVNGQLEFLAGGRQAAGTTVVRTYRWDDPMTGTIIPWYLAWQYSDWGTEDRTKAVKRIRVLGHQTFGTAGIHGAEPGELIDISVLEAGNSASKSGTILIPTSAGIKQNNIIDLDVDNLSQLTVRVDGQWDGFVTKDRIDEVVLDVEVRGARR